MFFIVSHCPVTHYFYLVFFMFFFDTSLCPAPFKPFCAPFLLVCRPLAIPLRGRAFNLPDYFELAPPTIYFHSQLGEGARRSRTMYKHVTQVNRELTIIFKYFDTHSTNTHIYMYKKFYYELIYSILKKKLIVFKLLLEKKTFCKNEIRLI